MRQHYERVTQAKENKCSPHINRAAVDLDDNLDLQCKKCLTVIAPLHSVNYYMKLTKNQTVLGEHFLVLRKMAYFNLKISEGQGAIFQQQPFQSMCLREITCHYCRQFLGFYFQTCNLNGTRWLLSSIAINLAQVSVMSGQRNIVQVLIRQLERLKPYKMERIEMVIEQLLAEESLIRMLMKHALDPAYHENKTRAETVGKLTESMEKFDKNASHLQRRAKVLLSMAKVLLDRYMKFFPQLKKQAREKDLFKRQEHS